MLGRAGPGRADGALVRISTPLDASEDLLVARARLLSFESALDVQIEAHWPAEIAEGS
jgi:hypothetical protein